MSPVPGEGPHLSHGLDPTAPARDGIRGTPTWGLSLLVPAIVLVALPFRTVRSQDSLGTASLPPALSARTTEACDSLGATRDRLFQTLADGALVDLDDIRNGVEARFPGIGLSLTTTTEEALIRILSHDWEALSRDNLLGSGRESSRHVLGKVVPRPDPLLRNLIALAKERRGELRAGILARLSGTDQSRALLILDAVVLAGSNLTELRSRRDSLRQLGVAIPYFVDSWIGTSLPPSRNAVTILLGAGGFAGSSPVERTFVSGPAANLQIGWMRRRFWTELSVQPTWGELRRPMEWRGHLWDPDDDIERTTFEIRGAFTPELGSPRLSLGPFVGWGSTEFRDSAVAKRDALGEDDRSIVAYSTHLLAGLSFQYRTASFGPMHGVVRFQGGRRFSLDDPGTSFSDNRWFFEFQAGVALLHLLTSGFHP